MSRTRSPSTNKPYGLARVATAWGVPRSTYYARRHRRNNPVELRKRGPRTLFTDQELTERIRQEIAASPFTGEGHRKFWARLRMAGVRTSKARVLRLMREAQLLAPPAPGGARGGEGAYRNHHHRSPEPDVGH